MNLGIPRLDEDHRQMFEMLTELASNVEHANLSGARVLVDEFAKVVRAHFAMEEAGMMRLGYPGIDAHTAEHDRSRAALAQLEQSIQRGDLARASEVMGDYLGHYFRGLLREDNLLAKFLRERDDPMVG